MRRKFFPFTYAQRDELLKSLGYASYAIYLRSPLWEGIRRRGYKANGSKCRLCKGKAQLLHHDSYALEVLEGRDLKPLIPLCNQCHTVVEFRRDGSKRMLRDVHTTYQRLLRGARARSARIRASGHRSRLPSSLRKVRGSGGRNKFLK